MDKVEELYSQGKKLMEAAFKSYASQDIDKAEQYRDKANAIYEQADKLYRLEHTDRDKLYGKNRNFGVCYRIFENNIVNNMSSKKGKKYINEVTRFIKTNPVIKEQLDIYNSLLNKKDIQDTVKYVDSVVECIDNSGLTRKEIKISNDRLIDLIESNSNINKLIDIDDKDFGLFEDVEYLILNQRNVNNVAEYENAKRCLSEHLKKNISEVAENYDDKIEKLSEKYQYLSNDEIELTKKILSKDTDKEQMFENMKKDTLTMIDEAMLSSTAEDKEQWNNIKDIISEKKYNQNELVEDILRFIDIQNSL